MKKTLAIILAVMLIVSCMTATAFAGMENFKKVNTYKDGQFTDVKSTAWYAENIKAAYEMGLVKGASATTFNVKGNLTVAETLALAARIHKMYTDGNADFVQGNPWYQVYKDYCINNAIVWEEELPAKLTVPCTRGQFAAIMSSALPGEVDNINNVFPGDVVDLDFSNYYALDVLYLMGAGMITGYEDGTFRPDNTISRAEVSAIVTRMADPSLRKVIDVNVATYKEHKDIPDFGKVFRINPVSVDAGAMLGEWCTVYTYSFNDLAGRYDIDEVIFKYVDVLAKNCFECTDIYNDADYSSYLFVSMDEKCFVNLDVEYADTGITYYVYAGEFTE